MKKVVVIGGGTGTFVTLSAIKEFPDIDLSAIVTVADCGGSTGRLRDEFGFLPVGDLRQALAALAKENGQRWIRDLLLYRFTKGSGLEGHNLGNLILTALQDMTGSTAQAVGIASKIFRLHGHIYPITTKNIQLVIEYQDGTVEIGEKVLDDETRHGGDKIVGLKTSPSASIYKEAKQTIECADIIIVGPGDLYGSILPNLIVEGAGTAIRNSKAKVVVLMNLMTRYSQTHNMSAKDHLRAMESRLGRPADIVVLNNMPMNKNVLKRYEKQHEFPVVDDLEHKKSIMRVPIARESLVQQEKGDLLHRSYLRHDSKKLAVVLKKIIDEV